MARLSDSITYGNHAITGDVNVGGTLTVAGVVYHAFNPAGTYGSLRAQATTKTDVGLGNIPNYTVTDSATGTTIMQRNGSGDTWCRLFRSTYSSTNSTIAGIYTTRTIGGDYMRPSTPAQVKASLNLSSGDVGLGNVPNWSSATFDGRYLQSVPNATATAVGGVKVRMNGTTAYITTNGSNA